MGKHVKEEVHLQVDSEGVTAGPDASDEEKLAALLDALADEDVEVQVETNSEEINE